MIHIKFPSTSYTASKPHVYLGSGTGRGWAIDRFSGLSTQVAVYLCLFMRARVFDDCRAFVRLHSRSPGGTARLDKRFVVIFNHKRKI